MRKIKQENADEFFRLLKDVKVLIYNSDRVLNIDEPPGTEIIYSRRGVHQRSVGKWCWEIPSLEIGSCEHFTNVVKWLKTHKTIDMLDDGEIICE